MARKWSDARADAREHGLIEEHRVAEHRESLEGRVRAYRLRQVRESQAANQDDVAAAMHVSQSRVSKIERGDIAHTEVGTLRSYVQALGGELRVVADFGDEELIVG